FLLCDTPPATALYSLSLHDALPISDLVRRPALEAEVRVALPVDVGAERVAERGVHEVTEVRRLRHPAEVGAERGLRRHRQRDAEDRKSTRLNSSHVKISYAVFCLKK